MSESVLLSFRLNGEEVEVAAPPHWTLLEVLRYKLDLIGSKQGCDKGDCGACTVQLDGQPVLSCLTLGVHASGRAVKTVEGMTSRELHPLQDCFDKWVAAQCGFCTPGILMAADAWLTKVGRTVTREEAAEALASNLCRCTGYTKILDAVVEASELVGAGRRTEHPHPGPPPEGEGDEDRSAHSYGGGGNRSEHPHPGPPPEGEGDEDRSAHSYGGGGNRSEHPHPGPPPEGEGDRGGNRSEHPHPGPPPEGEGDRGRGVI